jgi:hypothetical protein
MHNDTRITITVITTLIGHATVNNGATDSVSIDNSDIQGRSFGTRTLRRSASHVAHTHVRVRSKESRRLIDLKASIGGGIVAITCTALGSHTGGVENIKDSL